MMLKSPRAGSEPATEHTVVCPQVGCDNGILDEVKYRHAWGIERPDDPKCECCS